MRSRLVHMRGSDKIRIVANRALYLHLSNRKGLYTNESIGISLHVSCYTVVTAWFLEERR